MLLLLLLCQGSGINFGHFIKKSPFEFVSCSLKSSKANNETIGTEERNKVLRFLLLTEFISLLFQLAPILATRQKAGYILWKQILGNAEAATWCCAPRSLKSLQHRCTHFKSTTKKQNDLCTVLISHTTPSLL